MADRKTNKSKGTANTPKGMQSIKRFPIKKNLWQASIVIAAITFIAYLPVFSNAFVSLDDNQYIENQLLIRSFNPGALFSSFVMGNYHPLVMLVYTILFHFFKLNPVPYHLTSLLIHILNSCLVLWLIFYLSGSVPVSFIAALLFGIHPLHVESVAWASELKDVMYGFGFLGALICYTRYVKENEQRRLYIFTLLLFLFALFSKAMAVSLVPVLFLIDFHVGRKFSLKTFLEKIPFILLSVLMGIIAIRAQKSFEAIPDIARFSFLQRTVFACYGFITYIIRMFLPVNLCAYYSYPVKAGEAIPPLFYIYPVLLLLLLAITFYSLRRTRKIFFAVAFFTATVALVLQLLPVGGAITADRYAYIPSIGIFFLAAEGLVLIPGKKIKMLSLSSLSAAVGILFVLFFFYQTYNQVKTWKDSMSLWTNVIKISPIVPNAYLNRGMCYRDDGKLIEAEADFKQALVQDPNYKDAWSNLGGLYWEQGMADTTHKTELFTKALGYINKSITIDPRYAAGYSDRGNVMYSLGKADEAMNDFNKSIALDSTYDVAYYNRGVIYYKAGKMEQACIDFKKAASLGHQGAQDAYNQVCR